MSIKVAAIMPLYNKAGFVKETIESILRQSYVNFDLIIIDDASKDNSVSVVKSFNDSRIQLFENSINAGTSVIGNLLFEKSKEYDYAIRCDADDLFESNRFELLIEYMEKNKAVGICSSHLAFFGNQSGMIELPESDLAIKAKLYFTSGVSQGAAIFRMSVINQMPSPIYKNTQSNVGEDWMLFVELSRQINFGNIAQPLVRYRIHGDNISNHEDTFLKDRQYAIDFVMNHYEIPSSLKSAYLFLMGISSNFDANTIRQELKNLITHLQKKYERHYGAVHFLNEELQVRIQKAICVLADKNASLALKIHFTLRKYSNARTMKYCLIKSIRK